MPDTWIVISHPSVAGTATVTQAAFDSVWSAKGWVLEASLAGPGVDDVALVEWTEGEDYQLLTATYRSDVTTIIDTATVKWPDGSAGTLTVTAVDATWGEVNAFTITHSGSGKTVTQAAVTRDASGRVTTKPALTVA